MFSTQIAVMALTLVGVTPGAFKAWSDCNSVSSSSIAAMLMFSVSEKTDDEKKSLRRVWANDLQCGERAKWQNTQTVLETAGQDPWVGQSRLYEDCRANKQLIEQCAI